MHEKYLGNQPEQALQIVRQLLPEATSLRVIDDGQENLVIVADDSFTIRFPRTKEIWHRGITERRVLKRLTNRNDMPVPKLIKASEDPAFIVATFLKGQQLSTGQLRSLSKPALETIGKNIAEFAFRFHSALSVQEFQPLIQPPSWSYDDYLKRVLYDRTDKDPRVDALAKEYYQRWLDRKITSHKVVAHDDLHMGNLLFNDEFHISGVLDFGAVCIGTAEQELRQTYRLGEAGFEAAASTYEKLSGRPFDRETAKLWTITQELGAYCREDTDTVHERARENLNFWFPEIFT